MDFWQRDLNKNEKMYLPIICTKWNLFRLFFFTFRTQTSPSTNNQVRPEMPKVVTHTHDEDFSDEESDNKSDEKNSPADTCEEETQPPKSNNVTLAHNEREVIEGKE